MLKIISEKIKSLIPTIKTESFEWDKQTFLEWLFFNTIDIPFILIDRIKKVPHIKRNGDQKSLKERILNTLIAFLILFTIIVFLLIIPFIFTTDSTKFSALLLISVILGLVSIFWARFVYMSWDFKDLIRTKIFCSQNKDEFNRITPLLIQIINGTCFEWPSGKKFRFYIRDCIVFLISIIFANYIYNNFSKFLWNGITISSLNFLIVLILLLYALIVVLILFINFILFSTIFIVILILIVMLKVSLDFPLDINPYIEMGNTQKYGDMLITTLYNSALAVGIIPLLMMISQFFSYLDSSKIIVLQNAFSNLDHQTLTNVTNSAREVINQSVNQSMNVVTIGSFSKYFSWIFIFVFLASVSVVIVVILHYRIKQRKNDEQIRLEEMLFYVSLSEPENWANRNRYQYNMFLYLQILSLHEWPVKKIFILDILISVLLLFVSHIFSWI